jgi:diketogulonate reductase-like aldo/keto reductase
LTRKIGRSVRAGNRPTSGESSSYVQGTMTKANYDTIERLAEPAVCSVISGATSVEHVLSNAKAADWVLTDEELKEIRSILESES